MSTKKVKTSIVNKAKPKTLVIREAIKLAKKGARIYRATNGSNFGLPYLTKLVDKDRTMKLLVIQ